MQIQYPLCFFSRDYVEYILQKKMVGLSELATLNPFIRFLKKKNPTNPGDTQINFGTAVPALSDGFQTVEQLDCMRLWGGYAPILFIQLEQLNINHY